MAANWSGSPPPWLLRRPRMRSHHGAALALLCAASCGTPPTNREADDLAAGIQPDLAVPGDLLAAPDQPSPLDTQPALDLTAAADLAAAPDLAVPPDLAVSADAPPSPDLATPRDLVVASDPAPGGGDLLALADLTAAGDLAAARDLAAPPDLAAPADLTRPIDLAASPDLALPPYPAGPYGNQVGSVLANLSLNGYWAPTRTQGKSSDDPFGTVTMDMARRSGAKYMFLELAGFT